MPPKKQIMKQISLDKFNECFDKLKLEADRKYGDKDLMSVDEYFDKLQFVVDGLYFNIAK